MILPILDFVIFQILPVHMKKFALAYLIIILLLSCNKTEPNTDIAEIKVPTWELTGFEKADDVNPIMNPSDSLSFICPLTKKEIFWEERNVLNPSAIVKNGKVYLFIGLRMHKEHLVLVWL